MTGGQKFLQSFKAILLQHGDQPSGIELSDVGTQCFGIGGVQLKQFEPIPVAALATGGG